MKDDFFVKKKNITTIISKNINNSQDIVFEDMTFVQPKRKPLEELPVSKDLPPRKKTKPASGRKNSVGKIVHQNYVKEAKEK